MPGVPHKALNASHIVAGVDLHTSVPPLFPNGTAPHVVVYTMGWAFPLTSKKSQRNVKAGSDLAIARQHDLGIGPYHFWANWLLPAIWLGAGNKAEFGSGTVKLDQGRMAVAVLPWGINIQLDCQQLPLPLPLPTSVCLAMHNTVSAGVTSGDIWGGCFAMAFDAIITCVINQVLGKAAGKLGKLASKSAFTSGLIAQVAGNAVGRATITALRGAAKIGFDGPAIVAYVVGTFLVGTPLGYSYSKSVVGTHAESWNNRVNNLFSPDPPKPPGSP